MKNVIKSQWKRLVLALVYTIVAVAVYVVMVEIFWHLWYVNLIVGLAVAAIGCVVGYIYAKLGYDATVQTEANNISEPETEEKPVEKEQ